MRNSFQAKVRSLAKTMSKGKMISEERNQMQGAAL
jgi:hypothetical protein